MPLLENGAKSIQTIGLLQVKYLWKADIKSYLLMYVVVYWVQIVVQRFLPD